MNDMVVTYKVSFSNSNYSKEFLWAWNATDSVNKMFPLCLKKLFHLKNHKVFFYVPCIWFELILPFTSVMELECKWLVVRISW
jgi:hypothetical protein